jgi:dipeptidyl-peptidase-4
MYNHKAMVRKVAALLVALSWVGFLGAAKKPVTISDLVRVATTAVASTEIWAPDGQRFLYERERGIYIYDIPSRTHRLLVSLPSLESAATPVAPSEAFEWKNRGVKEQQVQWAADGKALLLSAGGDLFLFQIAENSWTQLTSTDEEEADPKLSPDGQRVSFRRNNDLFVLEISTRQTTRLTRDGSPSLLNGRPDWVYPEELDLSTAHWWSPDSRYVAYLQFDVSREPLFPHADLLPQRPVYEPQRYPKAGEPNADVRLGIVAASGGETRWMDLGETRDALLARVKWTPDSRALLVQKLNRIQSKLDLLHVDTHSGTSRVLIEEEDRFWVNLGGILEFTNQGNEFIWSSERDGFRHLYRHSINGRRLGRLTFGEWEVTEVAGVDEPGNAIYFVSSEANPLERHLYRAALDGTGRRRITDVPGTHNVSMAPGCSYFMDSYSNIHTPPAKVVRQADGTPWDVFAEPDRGLLEEFDIRPAEILQVRAEDRSVMYARLIRPAAFRPGVKYPAVVFVYGGPHSQEVRNRWTGLSLEQVLAHRGFVVWQLDNRGSGGRGHLWESALYRGLGATELKDQQAGVRLLVSMGFVDSSRIGIYGWSYGGYMTIYSLLNAPNLFRAGVAGAPVTDWRNYDSIYTERYLGLPSENAEAYTRSSVINAVRNLKSNLLIIHNLEDDNVLFQHTLQIADALQREGRLFDLSIYPQKTHGVTGPARAHMLETVVAFFERHLKSVR